MTVVLITGANRGLGLETARQLFETVPGIKIVLGSRDLSKVSATVADFVKRGYAASAVQLEVTDRGEREGGGGVGREGARRRA
jgi:NADP-dependent 3-hydroxy acid dehydrogenase YdfG